jgi:hypothetical protein
MQNGPKNVMSTRQPKPTGSFAPRSKRWTPRTALPQVNGYQKATSDILPSPRRKPGRGMSLRRRTVAR